MSDIAGARPFSEHDVVSLCEKVGSWPSGTIGTIVGDHGEAFLVEISAQTGKALDFIEVAGSMLAHIR